MYRTAEQRLHRSISPKSFSQTRGYLRYVPLLNLDAQEDCLDTDTPEDSISDQHLTSQAYMRASETSCHMAKVFSYVLGTCVFMFQIAGLILIWNGNIHVTFDTGPRLPPYSKSLLSAFYAKSDCLHV